MRADFCESCGAPKRAEFTVCLVSAHGRREERRLCGDCARDSERILMGDSGLPLADLLETLVIERSVAQSEQNRTKVCPNCGNTVDGVEQAGEVGCSVCYMVFAKEIDRVVRELHGRAHQ